MPKSRVKIFENILLLLAILIFPSLNTLEKYDLAGVGVVTAVLFIVIAFTLPQWEKNNYRWNSQSVPGGVKVIALLVFAVLFMLTNTLVCSYRLGERVMPNILAALIVQSLMFFVGAWIYGISYPRWPKTGKFSVSRTVIAIILSVVAFCLLNFIFYSHIGDTQAEYKATRRCYPGGGCYDAGMEQWGGYGAIVLLSVNLVQGMLIFNALAGFVHLYRNRMRAVKH